MSSSEQDFLYQRKYAVSSDGENSPQGDISAGGLSNKNTEWMQNSYTWVSPFAELCLDLACLRLACLVISWLDLAWLGLAWLGLAWLGLVGVVEV